MADNTMSKTIVINHNNKSKRIIITNLMMKKKTLADNFNAGGYLSYFLDGQEYILETDEDNIYFEAKIDTYHFNDPVDILTSVKRKRFSDMSEKLYGPNLKQDIYNKVSDKKIMNKKQQRALERGEDKSPSHVGEQYEKRIVYICWKHRMDDGFKYNHLGSNLAPKLPIAMNGRKDYTLVEAKDCIVKSYTNDENISYFRNSYVQLGTEDEAIITDFTHDGHKVSFWDYCAKLRNKSNGALNLNLYTTLLKNPS